MTIVGMTSKKYWQKIAASYNQSVGDKGDIWHEKVVNPVVFAFLGDLSGKVILDAGCGNGYLTKIMARTAQKVIGIDFTDELVNIARKKRSANLEFSTGNLEKLNFSNKFFDIVLCNLVLMDVGKLNETVKELTRVLKTRGIFVVSITHPCFENPPWTYSLIDKNGVKTGRVVQRYFNTGLVIDNNYQHYHYKIEDYLNAFSQANLFIEKNAESKADNLTPTFMIFKLTKLFSHSGNDLAWRSGKL